MYEGYQISVQQARAIVDNFMCVKPQPGTPYIMPLDDLVRVWNKLKLGPSQAYLLMEASGIMVAAAGLAYMHGYDIYQGCLIATAVQIQRRQNAQNQKENNSTQSST